jgi:uncharacterized protein (TIGR00266 family)
MSAMGDTVQHKIIGTTMPALEVQLGSGETIIADSGELSWMTDSIEMHTATQGAGAKGLFGAIKRVVSGGTLFLTEYTAGGRPGAVTFATKMPGMIIDLRIEPGSGYLVHRHGFVAATPGIQVNPVVQKIGSGIFGGEGFILQRLEGNATAWASLSGEMIVLDLPAGESLRVHPGHVGIFQESVRFEMTTIKGITNKFFGGDGIFLVRLTGPGRVWLQTLPLPNLAHALMPYLPTNNDR